jgi:tyrosyl-tRNA synthetase
MVKVITDEKKVDEVLTRGVELIFPDKASLKKKLMSGERIRLYCGFDPSAPALHIGNAIQLNKLRQFQELGHEVIFLIGDFTGMIGDPTDKSAARKKLTRKEVLANAKEYQKQASGYLKFKGENPAKVMYNSEWGDKVSFRDLIEISSNFTVQQMLQRDMFQKRLQGEKPIYLHEFLYPLAQGYDSVAMDVDLEIGGNDQMFNMLCGRDLMRAMKNKEKFVLTNKLLADETGKKMGKSEGNAVFLDQSPEDMYGAVMSWTDGTIVLGLELATALPLAEVEKIREALKDEKNNPRDFKMKLAFELVRINHGEAAAERAQEHFVKTIQKKETPDEVATVSTPVGTSVSTLIAEAGLAESNADAKRKIKQGGVEIGGEKVTDPNAKIAQEMDGQILKVGKRGFRKIQTR